MLPAIATVIAAGVAWLAWEVWTATIWDELPDFEANDLYLAELTRRALAAGEGDEQFHARQSASEGQRNHG